MPFYIWNFNWKTSYFCISWWVEFLEAWKSVGCDLEHYDSCTSLTNYLIGSQGNPWPNLSGAPNESDLFYFHQVIPGMNNLSDYIDYAYNKIN